MNKIERKIILISLSTPTYNNVRAASALPYHLIEGYQKNDVDFEVYSFNINAIETEEIKKIEDRLHVRINVLKRPWWIRIIMALHLLPLRVFLRYPLTYYHYLPTTVVQRIRKSRPDVVWIYGEEIAWLAKFFQDYRCIVTMPDCESLFYHRLLSKRFAVKSLFHVMKSAFAYYQYLAMERNMLVQGTLYHFVGREDTQFFHTMQPRAEVLFLHHPLYDYRDKHIQFHQPKIKLLVAGRNDFYMAEAVEDLFITILKTDSRTDKQFLQEHFQWTFLGKGWELIAERLQQAGFEVRHIVFAPDYIAELQQHDIQITPISVGTGTKGKVLDAIANGLLEIGTPGALENIAVESGTSCIIYQEAKELIGILKDIANQPERYEKMARSGMERVRQYHNASDIAEKLFS